MFSRIPDEWRYESPESFVGGVGAYSSALASIMGTVALPFDQMLGGPGPDIGGGYPRVLDRLKRAFLVVPEDMSPADALRCHQSLWNWVEKLSSAGDQHDLAFVFVLPVTAGKEYEGALAVGLCVPSIDPTLTGHGVWRQSDELMELLELAAAIRPMDALSWRSRLRSDQRRLALSQLRVAVTRGDVTAIGGAVQAVRDAFHQEAYHLDLFCNAPSHQNGNLLRRWLSEGVTSPVTQDWCAEGRKNIPTWLADEPEALAR
jgi:hypothetical protein